MGQNQLMRRGENQKRLSGVRARYKGEGGAGCITGRGAVWRQNSKSFCFLPIYRQMLLKGKAVLLLATACICSATEALRHHAERADQPDFADYRQSGRVIRTYSGNAEHNHYGVTLRLRDASVRALAEGTVYSAGQLRGYGNVVIVDHGHGWHTLYSDIAEIRVAVGQQVRRGAVLGTPREKRLFLVVSYKGNPINPSDVIGRRPRNAGGHSERVQSRSGVPSLAAVAINAG